MNIKEFLTELNTKLERLEELEAKQHLELKDGALKGEQAMAKLLEELNNRNISKRTLAGSIEEEIEVSLSLDWNNQIEISTELDLQTLDNLLNSFLVKALAFVEQNYEIILIDRTNKD
jgi:hypothetical protein